jgi:hypothetical protein
MRVNAVLREIFDSGHSSAVFIFYSHQLCDEGIGAL